jgi:hypothetical protein
MKKFTAIVYCQSNDASHQIEHTEAETWEEAHKKAIQQQLDYWNQDDPDLYKDNEFEVVYVFEGHLYPGPND